MRRLCQHFPAGCAGAMAVLLFAVTTGCGEKKDYKVYWPDGTSGVNRDGQIILDTIALDLGAEPDLRVDEGSPTIEILSPTEDELLIGTTLKVRARITDPDGVDHQTVKLTLQSTGKEVSMAITTEPDIYQALVDISLLQDKTRLVVEAADLEGNAKSELRTFRRDPGPTVLFLSPGEDSRHKGSVSIQIAVADRVNITSFELRIGSQVVVLKQTVNDADRKVYAGTVAFDDSLFNISLSGTQVLTATAVNANGATTVLQRRFVVDDGGPSISIASPSAGALIGGLIEITASVSDPAGVLGSSVIAVVGRDLSQRQVVLKPAPGSAGTFTAQFDTRTLDPWDLWPIVSVRAADTLGNESHRDITVGVDNGQPRVTLDSPKVTLMRKVDDIFECSHPFDPLGDDAVSDEEMVPQIATVRVRIEDFGNGSTVPSAEWTPKSGLDNASAKLFILDDTTQALVIDSTGDGFCDSINPAVVPLGSNPLPGQAVSVNLTAVNPTGVADYTPDGNEYDKSGASHPAGSVLDPDAILCYDGTEDDPPGALCLTTEAPGTASGFPKVPPVAHMTTAISDFDGNPAIFVPGPVSSGDDFRCAGLPFDFKANEFAEGWVCLAASARDNLGLLGVSPPQRLWVDTSIASKWLKGTAPPTSAGTAPDCTGTLNRATGVVDNTKPCAFRNAPLPFPQTFRPSIVRLK